MNRHIETQQISDSHPENTPKSARGVLAEIINIVESYGSSGLWLSRASPLIAKARMACRADRTAATDLAIMRLCLQDLAERMDTARHLIETHATKFGPARETVACLTTLRTLLDADEVVRGPAGSSYLPSGIRCEVLRESIL